MSRNKIIPYNPALKAFARELRKNMTKAEVVLWQQIRQKQFGVQFHRQVAIDNFIVDFYCHELRLAIEVDGLTHSFEEVAAKDEIKENTLNSLGIMLLRFEDNDVLNDMDNVIRVLDYAIEELNS